MKVFCRDCKKLLSKFAYNNKTKRCRSCSQKFRLRLPENNPFWNKHHTQASRDKISENHADFSGDKNPNFGGISEEHRLNIIKNHWSKNPEYQEERCPSFKGGRRIASDGYILIYSPHHPYKDKTNCVREHRLVMEQHLGRYLEIGEIVHHIDEDIQNNKIENLILCKNNKEHREFHKK